MSVLQYQNETKKTVVNKLILIGNGFDLALGLKTKYEDFLFWYFKKFIKQGLINIKPTLNPEGQYVFSYNEDEMFFFYNEINHYYEQIKINQFYDFNDIKKFLSQNVYKFTYKFKSSLLKKNIFGIKFWMG